MTPLISLKDVSFSYNKGRPNEVVALSKISLTLMRKDFISIMGVSGSGKSTLLHTLGGFIRPNEGRYLYKGRDFSCFSETQIAKLRNREFGFILQDYGLIGDYSALENVCLPLVFSNCRWSQIASQGLACMEALRVADLKDKKPNELSGGQCQRIAIARALIQNPEIIFADEPTGALDTENAELLMQLLKKINMAGTTIVLVTHDIHIAHFCNQIYEISDGKIHKLIKERYL